MGRRQHQATYNQPPLWPGAGARTASSCMYNACACVPQPICLRISLCRANLFVGRRLRWREGDWLSFLRFITPTYTHCGVPCALNLISPCRQSAWKPSRRLWTSSKWGMGEIHWCGDVIMRWKDCRWCSWRGAVSLGFWEHLDTLFASAFWVKGLSYNWWVADDLTNI